MAKRTGSDMKILNVHNMTSPEAKRYIEREISRADDCVKKIVVIHGSNNGTVLRDMVRKRIKSPRIDMIVPTYANDGETTIYLK